MNAQRNGQFGLWALLRVILPVSIGLIILSATHGYSYFDVFGVTVWTLFITHLTATFAFERRNLLDTTSFFFLIFASGSAADISVSNQFSQPAAWMGVTTFALYAILSLAGRLSTRSVLGSRPVRLRHVLTSVLILFAAVLICSSSKTLVGFLIVPGLLIVPALLCWSFVVPKHNTEKTG